MKTLQNTHPAILDVYEMEQNFPAESVQKLFGDVHNAKYDYELQLSSIEEFKEFNNRIYASSSVDRVASRVDDDAMIFKVEEVVNYGKEDFVGKHFYQLRKFGKNYFFNELSVSTCIHSRGFIPVTIVRTGLEEYKAKLITYAFGEGKRIEKSAQGRDYIKSGKGWSIFTDM